MDQIIQSVRDLLKRLNQECKFPITYKEAGVKEDMLQKIADLAVDDGSSFYNPRPVEAEALLPFLKKSVCWEIKN